jgi:hypothetical protein
VLDSDIMPADKTRLKFLWLAALFLSTLACRAATRLVIPDTPTPLPTATTTPTFTPTPPPTFTPTVIFEAACAPLLEKILNTVSSEVYLPGKRTDETVREQGGIFLVTYEITNDKLTSPRIDNVPDDLEDERDDRPSHEAIWDYFAALIPSEQREFISEFAIFTDGKGNHLAAVSPTFSNPEQWILQVDALDSENYYDLTYTLIHEQGHLLTLNSEQVTPSTAIFKFPENKTVYKQEKDACPQYFSGEGCSEPNSYVNQFFARFWPYIYEEWEQIDREDDEDTRYTLLRDFYQTHQDQFLTDYAPTSPAEDIAESWTYFVLSPKPELTSIASEKILFFYEYPELVDLRTQILTNICAEFPR